MGAGSGFGAGTAAAADSAPALFAPPTAERPAAAEKKTEKPDGQTRKTPGKPVEERKKADGPPPGPEKTDRPAGAFAPGGQKAYPPEIIVDGRGNKTLVIRGEDPPNVMMNQSDGQTQLLFGDDTAGVLVDNQGRKTLVVRGDPEPRPGVEVTDLPAPARPRNLDADELGPDSAPREKPYWLVEDSPVERPYFQLETAEAERPYWLQQEDAREAQPYWAKIEEQDDRPYWMPEPVRREILPSDVELAPPPSPPQATASLAPQAAGGDTRTLSYYMFQDEDGHKHVTNAPDDPRYRLFTVVVKVQRGLAGPRTRFTHDSLRPIIMRASAIYHLDPALIAEVIKSDSAFDARAVSWAGAQGLMQLIPSTAREMGVRDPFDPEDNVMGGSRYLRRMLDRFGGDLELAVAAYNCGPERVARKWRVPDIAETQNYVVIVLRNYERYKLQF